MHNSRRLPSAARSVMLSDAKLELEANHNDDYYDYDDEYDACPDDGHGTVNATCEPGDMAVEISDDRRLCTIVATHARLAVIACDDRTIISCLGAEDGMWWSWTLLPNRWPPKLSSCTS